MFQTDYISPLVTFHISLIGILVSIFTLLYSFIYSRKEELKEYSRLIKNGNKDPFVLQRSHFDAKYIKRASKISNACVKLVCASVAILILLGVVNFFERTTFGSIVLIMTYVFTGVECIFTIYVFIGLWKRYKDDIKI